MKSAYIFLFIWCCFYNTVHAQNNTSPYSILGIGDVETAYYGRWSGMANTSVALSSNRYLNQANPASYSKLDNQYFNMEVSGRYKYVNYVSLSSSSANTSSSDLSMKKLALATKITKNWGSAIGIMPFSSSNYSFYSTKTLQGSTEQMTVYNQGTGGLTQAYWANSYSLLKNLSLGIQTGYLFGSLKQQETLSSDLSSSPIVTTRNIYLRKAYITYGVQYKQKLSKKWEVGLGATYASKVKLNAEYSLHVVQGSTDLVAEEVIKNNDYYLPQTYTGGISLTYNQKLTWAADYKKQDWSALKYKGYNYALVNSSRYSTGLENAKHITIFNTNIETSFYQAGFYYNNSYLQLNGQQLKDYGFTMGIGANSKRNALGYHLSLDVGSHGTTNKGLIKEKYTQVNFTLSYRDFWFTKGRKYD